MTDIYEQYDAAFAHVAAYVILDKQGELVARIAFKFPRDGAGRLYAYVHWLGVPMVRGHANGYGYDKKSAACESAADKLAPCFKDFGACAPRRKFNDALANIGGSTWDRRLEDAGFTVIKAV